MVKKNEIYKCGVCGNVVEVLSVGGGQLVCCNKPMELMQEKTEDEGQEKHVLVIEKNGNKLTVKVGSILHPMTEEHHIEWIEVLGAGEVIANARVFPGEKPEAEFNLSSTENVTARAFCNVHGLWKSE